MGSVRTFTNQLLYRSIEDNFLASFGATYETFFYLQLKDRTAFEAKEFRSNAFADADENLLEQVLARFSPAKVVYESGPLPRSNCRVTWGHFFDSHTAAYTHSF